MTSDPRVYNYSNLKDQDKLLINQQLFMVDELDDLISEYEIDLVESESTLQTISYEEGIRALEEAKLKLIDYIVSNIISIIDSYPEDVETTDTDNYFYGVKEINIA